MRFTFPETPSVYTYSFASLESSLTDGSAANQTGVFTPSPLFLKVSRFRYLCPANASNPIASLPALFDARHSTPDTKKWERHSCLSPGFMSKFKFGLFRVRSAYFRTYVTSSVNESFWSLRNVQVVLKWSLSMNV